jgi:hypothetical protein
MEKTEIKNLVAVTLECDCKGGSPAECFRVLLEQLPREVLSGDVKLENFRVAEAHYIAPRG